MKIYNYTFILTVVLLLTAVAAHALTPSYDNTYTTGSTPLPLDIDNYSTLPFKPTQGYSSAIPNLAPYLSSLHLVDSSSGINQGLYIDRDSFTINTSRLTGAAAPKPATLALIAAGLIGLPFARRFRKYIR